MTTTQRIAAQATQFAPLRILLTVLSSPFYAAGYLAGLVLVVVAWMWAATIVGVGDARAVTRRGAA